MAGGYVLPDSFGAPMAGMTPDSMGGFWDQPMVSGLAFHPSAVEPKYFGEQDGPIRDGIFNVSGDDIVSYRLYLPEKAEKVRVVVYYFHGNAEVCTSADDFSGVFLRAGVALLSIDYRGYAWGSGQASMSKLCSDATECWLQSRPILTNVGCGAAKVVVMGRSIGATCAVHLASTKRKKVCGLIIDSGLMSVKQLPMVEEMAPMLFGAEGLKLLDKLPEPFDTFSKLIAVYCPSVVMHGQEDKIVLVEQGRECFDKLGGDPKKKALCIWPNAGHNDVCHLYYPEWSNELTALIEKALEFDPDKIFDSPFPLVPSPASGTPSGTTSAPPSGAASSSASGMCPPAGAASSSATGSASSSSGMFPSVAASSSASAGASAGSSAGASAGASAAAAASGASSWFVQIPSNQFYAEYHGHPLTQLEAIIRKLRPNESRGIIWLAGDSSLDNKHWLFSGGDKLQPNHLAKKMAADAINGYEEILVPPRMVKDVAYWLNTECKGMGADFCCINCAVEESTLASRRLKLNPHDELITRNLKPNDVLVVSAGGNDCALRPSQETTVALMQLFAFPEDTIEFTLALAHFIDMFKDQVEAYIKLLVSDRKLRMVIVCMIYYFDETPGEGWCEGVLQAMQYNSSPEKLQGLIDKVYELATLRVSIPGVKVVPLPLSSVLDGKSSADYCSRVEPSVRGGHKMAQSIALAINKVIGFSAPATAGGYPSGAAGEKGRTLSTGSGVHYEDFPAPLGSGATSSALGSAPRGRTGSAGSGIASSAPANDGAAAALGAANAGSTQPSRRRCRYGGECYRLERCAFAHPWDPDWDGARG